MVCSFEGLALGVRPKRGVPTAVLDDVFVEGATFEVSLVRGRADDIRAAQDPDTARAGDPHLKVNELNELLVPKKKSVSLQGPEWRAVRVRGARLYDVALVPLDVDGDVSRSSISGSLYFDANTIAVDGASDALTADARRIPAFSKGTDFGAWFVDPFQPIGCLADAAVLTYAVLYGRQCPWGMLRFLAAYVALRALRAFAPLAAMRKRFVVWAEGTTFGTASLWVLWLFSCWLGAVAAFVAVTSVQESTCATAGASVLALAFCAAALLVASPAQRFLAPAIFAVPVLFSSLTLTCPSANPVCNAMGPDNAAPSADGEHKPAGHGDKDVPCTDSSGAARGAGSSAPGAVKGAVPEMNSGSDAGPSWMDTLRNQAARVGNAVAGTDPDERAMLEASGAGATRTTLEEAESGDDPFLEAAGIKLRGGHDAFCGKPLFLPSSLEFAPGSSALLPGGQAELRRVARLLVRHRDRAFIVAAHVPATEGTNVDALSKARADAVVGWLKSWPGLEQTTFVPQGLGSRDGLVDAAGKDAVARLNDRLEIGLSCGDGSSGDSDAPKPHGKRRRGSP